MMPKTAMGYIKKIIKFYGDASFIGRPRLASMKLEKSVSGTKEAYNPHDPNLAKWEGYKKSITSDLRKITEKIDRFGIRRDKSIPLENDANLQIILKAKRKHSVLNLSSALSVKRGYMSREAFGLENDKAYVTDEILRIIISHGYEGVCRQQLVAWDKHLESWGYKIYNNDYDYLAKRSKWFKETFVDQNYGSIVFALRDCSCGKGYCKNVYVRARHFDPVLDNGLKIKGLVTTDPRILKLLDQIRSLLISK